MQKIKIVISGAAVTNHCAENVNQLAYAIGKEIAKQDGVVVTGATTGLPLWAAKGAYEHNGFVIGFSPAMNSKEHIQIGLPVDYHHLIFYTGEGYSARNLRLIRAGDGAIFICGRTGTLNEFIIAFEEKKPMAILTGSGGEEEFMKGIIEEAHKEHYQIVWEKEPQKVVAELIKLIKEAD
jgi:uncharacterized protein (TIGR00725 family)